ncbi:MAG: dihydroorotase [Gammaproteobacteria bacterium]|nr:dihydroorotase [Gammaproteobacteria bacterium]
MILIQQAFDIDANKIDLEIPSDLDIVVDGRGLTVFPGLIDPHVHFRVPGMDYKEDWRTAASAAIAGGYTMVFDMPNTVPPTITKELLIEKKAIIDRQLKEVGIPLRYHLFFGADKPHLDQIPLVKKSVIGIKVFMGCSTGNLVIDDDESLHAVFSLAASNDMLVAVHAEDEELLKQRKHLFRQTKEYQAHSQIRNVEVACRAVEKAIYLSQLYNTKLYILHASTQDELALIKKAKKANLPVFAETTPHHLFLNETAYAALGGKAVVNPPLRTEEHQEALFAAIHEGIIDTIGSDHAPHTEMEKAKPYGECPSGMPGIETTLALLLNAYHADLLTLKEIVSLTSKRAQAIFNLTENQDYVLVDLNKQMHVAKSMLKTKCAWSPYLGYLLKGWPEYTILKGVCYKIN